MAVSPARRIAFDILQQVEQKQAYASDVLHERLGTAVKREDAALATELTLGVLRWQRLLDCLLERQIQRPLGELDPEVLLALRMGLYQLRFLSRVPARAAVSESVELVKRARKRSAATLVNAVLRRAPGGPLGAAEAAKLLPGDAPLAERLGILHSHPTWLVARWLGQFGEARTLALLEANNRPPLMACMVNDPAKAEAAMQSLKAAGLEIEPGRLLRSAVVVRGGSAARSEAFRRGWISIQDEASQAIPLLLEVRAGQSVLDLCAAPGVKTILLAREAGPESLVVACDLHWHRLRALRTQLARVGRAGVSAIALDGTAPLPFAASFDRILVDAPCSGTGTLARHPEIRWRLRPGDLQALGRKQLALVAQAAKQLAPGGRLVYSTCSLEPEENEQVVAELQLAYPELQRVKSVQPLASQLAASFSAAELFDSEGYFRTFPGDHSCDGFFAAVFERVR
jgi:16S rRNA (cytosine967-C5)-methyltransferase